MGLQEAGEAVKDEVVVGGDKKVGEATCDRGQGLGEARGPPNRNTSSWAL